MKIYIAGKITNNPSFKAEFKKIEDKLVSAGHAIMNPSTLPEQGFEQPDYWHVCKAMIDVCDIVYFMGNWTDSKGCHFERGYCDGIKKPYEVMS